MKIFSLALAPFSWLRLASKCWRSLGSMCGRCPPLVVAWTWLPASPTKATQLCELHSCQSLLPSIPLLHDIYRYCCFSQFLSMIFLFIRSLSLSAFFKFIIWDIISHPFAGAFCLFQPPLQFSRIFHTFQFNAVPNTLSRNFTLLLAPTGALYVIMYHYFTKVFKNNR